jgi:hypothetical protein
VSSLLEVILLVAFAFCMGMMSSSLPSSAERTRRWMANRRQRRQVLLERSPGDLYGEHGEIVLVDGQTCRYGTVLAPRRTLQRRQSLSAPLLRRRRSADREHAEGVVSMKEQSMKIVGTDNQDRETVSEFVWLDGLPNSHKVLPTLKKVCARLNQDLGDGEGTYFVLRADAYQPGKSDPR